MKQRVERIGTGIAMISALVFGLCSGSVTAQSGSLDPTYTVGTGANGRVYTLAAQQDGKHIVGGAFTTYNGSTANRVARVNRNGTLDASFATGTGANGQVNHVAVDGNGKVLLGGTFTAYNGTACARLVRLNTNGSIDAGFTTGTGFNGAVTYVLPQADGKVIVVGAFTAFNGTPRGRVARLNTDGSLDATYAAGTGANGDVYGAALDGEGRLLIGGLFTSVNGVARTNIARLTTSGAADAGFNPGAGPNNAVYCVAVQRDGRVLIGGMFTSYNGMTPSARIARLDRNGTYDNTFAVGTGFNSWVYTITLQGDGKVLAGGDFSTYNGGARNRMVRLNTNGSVDAAFSTGTTFNNWVYAITWQPEGLTTVAGGFTSFNGTARNRIARLRTGCDENVQLTVKTDGSGSQTSWELVGEGFTYAVCSGSGFADNTETTVGCCVPHGPLRLRVLDSAGDGMTTGGYVLKDASGRRIIDNTNDGAFAAVSEIAEKGAFYLPLSSDRLIMSQCDKVDWAENQYIVATADADVSAQWGVGDQTDDGYEFWFYDPDGTYSQRKYRNHATNGGTGTGATRACHLRITWPVNPVPQFKLLNVKVRSRVNGVNREWGSACRFKLDPITAACPLTKLIDTPGQQYFSCGVTRARSQNVTAKPVPGANRYEFEFVNVADGYSYTIQGTTYQRSLGWTTPALVPGRTYQVRVHASRDNGATWCAWGEACDVTIAGPGAMAEAPAVDHIDPLVAPQMSVWPNPTNGDAINVGITGLTDAEASMDVVIMDMTGKLVHQQRYSAQGPVWRNTIGLEQRLPTGQYFMRIIQGENTWQERFVVSH